jgi:hypothetical protein
MKYVYCLFVFVCLSVACFAEDVSFQWDPNTEQDLAGYRLFMRESHLGYDYSQPAWEGKETTCTISNVLPDKDYRFVCRAYDTEKYESGNSNEVSYIFGTVPDGKPPGKPKIFRFTATVEVP